MAISLAESEAGKILDFQGRTPLKAGEYKSHSGNSTIVVIDWLNPDLLIPVRKLRQAWGKPDQMPLPTGRLEQNHRRIKSHYKVKKAFNSSQSAERFCQAFEEVRNFSVSEAGIKSGRVKDGNTLISNANFSS